MLTISNIWNNKTNELTGKNVKELTYDEYYASIFTNGYSLPDHDINSVQVFRADETNLIISI